MQAGMQLIPEFLGLNNDAGCQRIHKVLLARGVSGLWQKYPRLEKW